MMGDDSSIRSKEVAGEAEYGAGDGGLWGVFAR
jgi:hypothetical protein